MSTEMARAPRDDGARHPHPLLERDADLATLASLLDAAARGHGGVAVVEGPAGIGKSQLLAAARAAATGFDVLSARGGELERDFPWGVARQLFETRVALAPRRERAALLEGAARHAAEPLGLVAPGPSGVDATFAALHGLYWLVVNITARRRVLLVVDDAHWADEASLRFLVHLGRRAEELPLLMLAAQRPGEAADGLDIAQALRDLAHAITPAPLSAEAVGVMLERRWRRSAVSFVQACHAATGGNPFLVTELAAQLRADGVSPDEASATRVADLGPRTVARAVLARARGLPEGALRLARAVATLGTEVELRHAAALVGMDEAAAAVAADALARVDVLRPGRPLDFVHPVVRAAVRDDVPRGERAALHRRAAEMLDAEGLPPGRIAVHLLACDAVGDPWVVERLRAAAARAVDRGAPDAAVGFLRRAYAEPPAAQERPAVLRQLGQALLLTGDMAAGADALREALRGLGEPRERALAAQALGLALVPSGAYEAALAAQDQAVAEARAAGDEDLTLLIAAEAACNARLHGSTVERSRERLAALSPAELPPTPGGRALLAELAMDAVLEGRNAATARELGQRALAAGTSGFPLETNCLWDAPFALWCADCPAPARAALDEMRARARDRGSLLAFTRASMFLAMLALHEGRVADAEAEARASLNASEGQSWYVRGMATACLCHALVDRGEIAEAGAAVGAIDGWRVLESNFMFNLLRLARARLLAARGDCERAAAELLELGELERRWRDRCPPAMPWRTYAARALHALGRSDEARELAQAELALARVWGAPSGIGRALLTLGTVTGSESALAEAVATLASSPARLEYARALATLGAHLRRTNHRAAAREPLARAVDIAHRCGAQAVVADAQAELRATGARPRRLALSGVEALTASERRVTAMAAEGMSNREIAQALFVTMRTVEVHLTHAYAKLGISSREQLGSVLPAAPS